ncbi:hypothetical protein VI08_01780 [Luteibacter yeojuensis]|uniref:Competence protein CoiA-like protein n=2 Tax=Luteibacter yeojuensis TaxID=345309 RepID=A0A0F3L149_9GAMM|nr:hypothetical protein VI08_01780 [Luteibacter yeojuensis]
MEIAVVDGVRSLPAPGLKGECQACGRPAVAKCGEIVMWHWAHAGRRVCDPWWENEGPWHRSWKAAFPLETHEQVMFAPDGEKHIADLRLPDGLVIELQHSKMEIEEMRSREAFYQRMIWIVDASPFVSNIAIFDALPDPKLPFTADLIVWSPHPAWRTDWTRPRERMSYENLLVARRSQQTPGSTMLLLASHKDRIGESFDETYSGHHLVDWKRPRTVWLETTKPTYLDLGDGRVGRLMRWRPERDSPWCLKLFAKEKLLRHLLARIGNPSA